MTRRDEHFHVLEKINDNAYKTDLQCEYMQVLYLMLLIYFLSL